MSKNQLIFEFGFLRLDARKRLPLFRQLYDQIRQAILEGRLRSESRIPSSRDLMQQLGVSRTTVTTALDLLIDEGYLQTRQGSGTFVSSEFPDEAPMAVPGRLSNHRDRIKARSCLGKFGRQAQSANRATCYRGTPEAFCPGEPALDQFPVQVWSKIARRVWKTISSYELSYGEPAGYLPLRKAISDYLRIHRGVHCQPQQVMIVNGTQQAIDIVSRICLDPGDKVLFENPGYINAREAIEGRGAKIVGMTVDESGADIRTALRNHPQARMAYVTPSHQFPMGVTMSIERRLELIRWASRRKGLILEDDYDSEYRYHQKPIPSLQGLDESGSTVYIGSCSKIIYPAMGMGYAVVPPSMMAAFENTLRMMTRSTSQIDQLILSEFIKAGHFVRHLRRMRRIHGERRKVFIEEIHKRTEGKLEIIGSAAGLHCTALIKNGRSDVDVVNELAEHRIIARPLSRYYVGRIQRLNGLVLGFACASPQQIKRKVIELASIL